MQLTVVTYSIVLLHVCCSCAEVGSPPPLPKQGVRFYSGLINQSIPNYGMISESVFRQCDYGLGFQGRNDTGENDGLNDGLWCQSALNKHNIGTWKIPNGTFLNETVNHHGVIVYKAHALGQVGLLRPQKLNSISSYMYDMEGVYQCTIEDEEQITQTLVLWIAEDEAYKEIGDFSISDDMRFHLPPSQPRDTNPPKFTLQFTVIKAPPTNVTCYVGNQTIEEMDIFRQPLNTIYTSDGAPTTYNVTATLAPPARTDGYYQCKVSVYRSDGNSSTNLSLADQQTSPLLISVTNTPSNCFATWTENNTVEMTWTASSPPVTGYEVFYTVNGTEKSYSGANTTDNSITINGLLLSTMYTFHVVAYHDEPNTLPSERCDFNIVYMNSSNSTTTECTTTDCTATDSTTKDTTTTDSTTKDTTTTDSTTTDSNTTDSTTTDSTTTDRTITESTITESNTTDGTNTDNTNSVSTNTDSTITYITNTESTITNNSASSVFWIVSGLVLLLIIIFATICIALICAVYYGKLGKKSRTIQGKDNLNSVLKTEKVTLSHIIGHIQKDEDHQDDPVSTENEVFYHRVDNPLYEERKLPGYEEIEHGPKVIQEGNQDVMTFPTETNKGSPNEPQLPLAMAENEDHQDAPVSTENEEVYHTVDNPLYEERNLPKYEEIEHGHKEMQEEKMS